MWNFVYYYRFTANNHKIFLILMRIFCANAQELHSAESELNANRITAGGSSPQTAAAELPPSPGEIRVTWYFFPKKTRKLKSGICVSACNLFILRCNRI